MSLQHCSFSALVAANTCDLGGNDVIVRECEQNLWHDSSHAFPDTLPQTLLFTRKNPSKKYLCLLDRRPSPPHPHPPKANETKKNQHLL